MSAIDIITKRANQQKEIMSVVDEEFKNGSPDDPGKAMGRVREELLKRDLIDEQENEIYMKSYFSEKMYSTPDLEVVDVRTEK